MEVWWVAAAWRKRGRRSHQRQHHGICRHDLLAHEGTCSLYEENYNPETHISETEIQAFYDYIVTPG